MTKAPEQQLDLLQLFRAARKVSTPLIAIRTTDQPACMRAIAMSIAPNADDETPLLMWDAVRGVSGINAIGTEIAASLGDPMMTANPAEMVGLIAGVPKLSVLFMHNAQRTLDNNVTVQGISNLRDLFKSDRRMLVMLCPDVTLPSELASDVLVLDDELPTEAQLRELIIEQVKSAPGIEKLPDDDTLDRAVSATAGLAMFPAEQVVAMSLRKSGIDLGRLWERKRQQIEQQPGLSVWRGGETFAEIGGCENAKRFGVQIGKGAEPPRGIVFIDEIEKAMAGSASDSSGVSQDMLGTLLTWMQDKNASGMILVGPPGAAKSAYAKALGNTLDVPTIGFDLSGMKGSLVGESGQNLRRALKVVDAVTQGRALFVATCNSIGELPPELRRRFKFGTFFFDLPTADERAMIWTLYRAKFNVSAKDKQPLDEGWTGAEIRTCCELTWRLAITLRDAAGYIVPVAKSAAEKITKLREQANGRFISAARPGVYTYERTAVSAPSAQRVVDVDD